MNMRTGNTSSINTTQGRSAESFVAKLNTALNIRSRVSLALTGRIGSHDSASQAVCSQDMVYGAKGCNDK